MKLIWLAGALLSAVTLSSFSAANGAQSESATPTPAPQSTAGLRQCPTGQAYAMTSSTPKCVATAPANYCVTGAKQVSGSDQVGGAKQVSAADQVSGAKAVSGARQVSDANGVRIWTCVSE